MQDELKQETREQLAALCRSLVRSHGLPSDSYDELYTHLEDKILAYLHGEEALTEEDALVLAREHFGKPAAVQRLLNLRPVGAVDLSLPHLVAVMSLGSVIAYVAMQVGMIAGLYVAQFERAWIDLRRVMYEASGSLGYVAALTVLWLVFFRYSRRTDRSAPFVLKVPVGVLLITSIGFVAAFIFSSYIQSGMWWATGVPLRNAVSNSGFLLDGALFIVWNFPNQFLRFAFYIALPFVWFLWCGEGDNLRRLGQVAIAYCGFQFLVGLVTQGSWALSMWNDRGDIASGKTLVMSMSLSWATHLPYVAVAAVLYWLLCLANSRSAVAGQVRIAK